mgnify:CR=1 FL=1
MKKRGRAWRRRQARKAKDHARWVLTAVWGITDPEWIPSEQMIGIWASTHCKPCSCWGCGNARRAEGPTRQELRSLEDLKHHEDHFP